VEKQEENEIEIKSTTIFICECLNVVRCLWGCFQPSKCKYLWLVVWQPNAQHNNTQHTIHKLRPQNSGTQGWILLCFMSFFSEWC